MVYVTGDMHADLKRFNSHDIKKLKKEDILIVCGDFGFVWDGSDYENKILKSIGERKFTTLFVDGTHENFDLLNNYKELEWNGGKVHHISGNLYHLKRGEVYNINGEKFFAFGGGESLDKDMRMSVGKWWKEELPSIGEMKIGVKNLNNANREVDYVITHEPPFHVTKLIDIGNNNINILGKFFDDVDKEIKYKKWFFGSCHINRKLSSKYCALFNDVISVCDYAQVTK